LADDPGREGVAFAAARMLSRGTANRTADEIHTEVEGLGANLSTRSGNNTFYVQAGGLSEDWRTLLELVADVVVHPTFPADQWAKMKPRLLATIDREGDSWSGELQQRLRKAVFEDHPWSQTSTGRRDVVAGLKAKDLATFYRQRLAADQAVLAVFGDVNPDEVVREARRLFKSMPAEADVKFDPPPRGPIERTVEAHLTDKPLAAAAIAYGPGLKRSDPDYPAVQVLTRVLSSFPSGWLEQALRGEGPGLAYAVGAYPFAGVVPGYVGVLFNSQSPVVLQGLARSREVIERARSQPVKSETLQRARAAVLGRELLSQQTNSQRATMFALDVLYGLGLDASEDFVQRVHDLTPDDLLRVARRYLDEPVTVIISDQRLDDAAVVEAAGGSGSE
ncbi:MAG: pitrilysin family protein, partial [Phycisphaeraceae bacterium]|nr:pitrilysin family protein [Phycisphaeraceae bacterium]